MGAYADRFGYPQFSTQENRQTYPQRRERHMKNFHLHLVSDSTGETVSSVARAALVQFENVIPEEHFWSLVRTRGQMEKVLSGIAANPGMVLYTVVDKQLRHMLKEQCARLGIPCVPVIARVIQELTSYLEVETTNLRPGQQHTLTQEYFDRVDAINYALAHDDGQSHWDLQEADIVLVGVSRTSKSPTCMYLAYKGYKAANIPYVMGCPLPDSLATLKAPLIVGLVIDPERLQQIRRTRLQSLKQEDMTNYVDIEQVKLEVQEAKRFFVQQRWPMIDVTRRSVEETAAQIVQIYQNREENKAI